MIKNLSLFLLSILLAIVIAEGLLRVFSTNPYGKSNSMSIVEIRKQRSNINRTINRKWLDAENSEIKFRTDEHGYILPINKYNDSKSKILFLGGSTTECSYVSEHKRFPYLVSLILKEKYNLEVETYNAGKSGNSTQDIINILVNDSNSIKPDFVVIMEATNDAGILSKDHSYLSRMSKELALSDFIKSLVLNLSSKSYLVSIIREAITIYSNSNGEIKASSIDDLQNVDSSLLNEQQVGLYRQNLLTILGILKAKKIVPIFMTQPLASRKNIYTPNWANVSDQEKMNNAIRTVANENDVVLIDLADKLSKKFNSIDSEPWSYLYDGMHVTDLGSELYAETISEVLVENIK